MESLSPATLSFIHSWVRSATIIGTTLVRGTSAEVYSGAAYIEAARQKGTRIAVVNVEKEDPALLGLREQDWYSEGDTALLCGRFLDLPLEVSGGCKKINKTLTYICYLLI